MEPGVSYCYDRVAVCEPTEIRPTWRTIRQSQLVPQLSGLLTVPTSRAASRLASQTRVLCGLQVADGEADDDQQLLEGGPGAGSASGAADHWYVNRPSLLTRQSLIARVVVRNQSSPQLLHVPRIVALMSRHVAQVDVLHVTSSPSTTDFCTQVGWMQKADIVLTHHGSHLVNAAYMRRGTHIIEILPYLYESVRVACAELVRSERRKRAPGLLRLP